MARGQMSSSDVGFAAIWGVGGFVDTVEGLSYFTTAEKARLTAALAAVTARGAATQAENARAMHALKKIILSAEHLT